MKRDSLLAGFRSGRQRIGGALGLLLVGLTASVTILAEDLVELSSGAKVRGEVVSRTKSEITVKVRIGERTLTRKYPLSSVRAMTVMGKREVLNGDPAPAAPAAKKGKAPQTETADAGTGESQRTRQEVDELIDRLGRTPPDWYESTPLVYPETLDLKWPPKPEGGWNNQKNVGQYMWDVINPNPGKWREGVRLIHHLMLLNKDDRELHTRAMRDLGRMYHHLLEDYARAAFWWRKAGVDRGRTGQTVYLAECYWRLGNREMAVELLGKTPPQMASIKLWADLGETTRALKIADSTAGTDGAHQAFLYAGDACRLAGDYRRAIAYYQKVVDIKATGNLQGRIERSQNRARANLESIKRFELLDIKRVPDGTYSDESLGYEGQVRVEVTMRNQRIDSVRVTQHREKQFYAALTDTPRKIILKQGVKGVDATSGATITSEAIINATAKALAGAAK